MPYMPYILPRDMSKTLSGWCVTVGITLAIR